MSFGLSNEAANFQGYINKILAKRLDIFVIVYLDNILIYTEDLRQLHMEVVQLIQEQLQKYNLYANLKKYKFYEDEVQFWGFVVLAQDIKIEEKKIKVLKDWPEL